MDYTRRGERHQQQGLEPKPSSERPVRTRTRKRVDGGPTSAPLPSQPRSGFYRSLKMGRPVCYNSAAQLDLLYLLDADPGVLGYTEGSAMDDGENDGAPDGGNRPHSSSERPFMEYKYEGELVTISPHYLVQTRTYTALVECIPWWRYTRKVMQLKRAALHSWASTQPTSTAAKPMLEYVAFRPGPKQRFYLENLRRLTPYATGILQPGLRARIYTLLDTPTNATGPLTVGELAHQLGQIYDPQALPGVAAYNASPAIWWMAYRRELLLPLASEPLLGSTPVYLPHQQPADIALPPPELRFPARAGLGLTIRRAG